MSDLTVTGVTLAYENTNIIEDINIELHDNELVCSVCWVPAAEGRRPV